MLTFNRRCANHVAISIAPTTTPTAPCHTRLPPRRTRLLPRLYPGVPSGCVWAHVSECFGSIEESTLIPNRFRNFKYVWYRDSSFWRNIFQRTVDFIWFHWYQQILAWRELSSKWRLYPNRKPAFESSGVQTDVVEIDLLTTQNNLNASNVRRNMCGIMCLCCRVLILLVLGHQIVHVALRFRELHFILVFFRSMFLLCISMFLSFSLTRV